MALNWNLKNTYRSLPNKFYSDGIQAAFPQPEMVVFNQFLAQELALLAENQNLDGKSAAYFSGNLFPQGTQPISQAYAGHQFGSFTMLGDGRATLLGEQLTLSGELFDIQLKGSGRTIYSRRGDGKAALAPMLREYLMCEAMYALKIPTTRALAVVTTGEQIARERSTTGAVLTRVAKSHIRVATFQYAAAYGSPEDIKALADYTIQRHFPYILEQQKNPYLLLLGEVIADQAKLIAKWQQVGFIHGVMNTDNMSICGETIDYGPCAFMDRYNPKAVFSSIDVEGLYRYENQPRIAKWNLTRFAECLLPLIDENPQTASELATQELEKFTPQFEDNYWQGMAQKLGIENFTANDQALIEKLLNLMQTFKADYSNTFVRLTLEIQGKNGDDLQDTESLFSSAEFAEWKAQWQQRQPNADLMQSTNPFIIPRNALVEEALEQAEQKNMQKFTALFNALQQPFDYDKSKRAFQNVTPIEGYRTFCGT